ncbi:MAG TPA: TetR/AcrR family transcriptional regulator C-terminal ligand-binding domain-containing protein [Candidatus Limnocylindrales bacterium]|nr:TetR/AcrR family transcriptional regulator C-terminal ligand-binding domain-containing protein [Candidatus Limnocylindrales bacterium]
MTPSGSPAAVDAVARPARVTGRPRDPGVDAAILDGTLRLLDEVGYQGMSIAAIASAAGVGRPAVYRRYRSRADIVVAAILRITAGPEPDLPSDPRQALRVSLGMAGGALASPAGMAVLGSLLAEQRRDPELLAAFRARIFDPRRALVRQVVRQGIDAGTIAPDADGEAIDGLLFGALLARAILGEPVDEAWIDRVLDQTWRGLSVPAPEVPT